MSNHGPESEQIKSRLDGLFKELGATKRFPEGKMTLDDEGELAMGVGETNGKVVLHFGKPVSWIGMLPEQAEQLAILLIQRAGYVKKL